VAGEGELARRVAQVLSTDAEVTEVAKGVTDLHGWDVVVGASGLAVTCVTAELSATGRAVYGASPVGLGIALARSLGVDLADVAVATPGPPLRQGLEVSFPPPVGPRRATELQGLPYRVLTARTDDRFASVLVQGDGQRRLLIDHSEFLRAIALAAGIALLPVERSTPVWERPEVYLRKIEAMGLVAAAPT
jgi:hypothetical protein